MSPFYGWGTKIQVDTLFDFVTKELVFNKRYAITLQHAYYAYLYSLSLKEMLQHRLTSRKFRKLWEAYLTENGIEFAVTKNKYVVITGFDLQGDNMREILAFQEVFDKQQAEEKQNNTQ